MLISLKDEDDAERFLKGLGAGLSGLMASGQSAVVPVCLTLLWSLSGSMPGGILSIAPDPSLIAASASAVGQSEAGILLLEEIFCAAATAR